MRHTGNLKLLTGLVLMSLLLPLAGEVKPLTEYREVTRMWMGVEEGVLRPASYQQFSTEADTYVAIHAKDQQMLEKGEHWATIDPENLELKRRVFDLENARAIRKEQDALQEAKDSHVEKLKELHETQGQQANLREILAAGELDAMFEKRVKEALAELENKLEVLEAQTSKDALTRQLELIKEDFSIQSAQREKDLKALEKQSVLVAKRAGKLQLGGAVKRDLEELEDKDEAVWVTAQNAIGSISSEDNYEIIVSANGPLLTGIPTEDLLILFQDPRTGQQIRGSYVRTEERDTGRQIQRDFIFKVDEGGIPAAKRASGSSNSILVYRKFDKPYRLVLKKDLVFENPEELERSGWGGMVRQLWPGSKIIQVGPQSIAIDPAK